MLNSLQVAKPGDYLAKTNWGKLQYCSQVTLKLRVPVARHEVSACNCP
jgi:hypothetical protein